MKTRTNQPVFLDNGEKVDDSALGGTKLYKHTITGVDQFTSKPYKLEIITTRATKYPNISSITDDYIYAGRFWSENQLKMRVIGYGNGAFYGVDPMQYTLVNEFGSFTISTYEVIPL